MTLVKKKVVIIGGGTAGLVIANRIQDHFDVTVIEKSRYKKYPTIYRIPLFIALLFRSKKLKFMSKRDITLSNGRSIPFYESNLLGGASVMNGCVHMLGSASKWKLILERFNVNYKTLLDSYNEIFTLENNTNNNRINLNLSCQNVIDDSFIKTLNEKGIGVRDTNLSNEEGCGPVINTVKKYFRTSVISLINKKKFEVVMGEVVRDIRFDNNKIVGIETNSRKFDADYVILSGGVIGTCDALLRMKEKDKNNLFKDVVFGENIQDHTNLRINILANKKISSLNEVSSSFYKKLILIFRHLSGVSTVMRGTGATSAVHLDLNGDGEVDTRIQVVQFSEPGRHGSGGRMFSSTEPGFSLSITAIYPESRGNIIIDGEKNVINSGLLSSKQDVELLKKALKYCLELLHSKPICDHILRIENEDMIKNDPEKYIANNIFSGAHLIGGADEVIDSDFKVHNTQGLYVCDASVFNQYAASNIHSSVVLVADIFSKKFISNNSV